MAASAALAAALAAGIVSQQFTVFTIPTALLFYTTIALATALGADPVRPESRVASGIRVAAAAFALGLCYLALRYTVADHELRLAQRGVDAADVARASSEYATYARWRLPGTAADLWYSRAMIALAQKTSNSLVRFQALAQSGAAAMRATSTAEDPFNAWYNAAALAATQNDAAGAERNLRAAIAARPNWFKPHWILAQVLAAQSRTEEALREAELAVELNGGKNAEVARTLQEIRARRAAASLGETQKSNFYMKL